MTDGKEKQPIEFLFGEFAEQAEAASSRASGKARRMLKGLAALGVVVGVVAVLWLAWPYIVEQCSTNIIPAITDLLKGAGDTDEGGSASRDTTGLGRAADRDATVITDTKHKEHGQAPQNVPTTESETGEEHVPSAVEPLSQVQSGQESPVPGDSEDSAAGGGADLPKAKQSPPLPPPAQQAALGVSVAEAADTDLPRHVQYHEDNMAGWISVKAAPGAKCSILWMKGREIVYKIRRAKVGRGLILNPKGQVVRRITVAPSGKSTCTVAVEYAGTVRWGWSYDQSSSAMVLRASLLELAMQ